VLERIEQIQGVGLLHDANGKPFKFHKATLIYADNGRGKSTLAGVLRSAATGDGSLISGRATLDGTQQPGVVMQLGSGHRVSFVNGTWSETRPELLVFDADFIEKNVHSGGAVNTGHRKNLLEFALGEQAVSARRLVEQATTDAQTASDKVKQLTAQLSGHHPNLPLVTFERLPEISDADVQIEDLQKRIAAANSIDSITKKPVPNIVPEPIFDLDAYFTLLQTSLDDVQEDAEKIVRSHVTTLVSAGAEGWLSQGRSFDDSVKCPYCGQGTTGNELIRAYRTYFNAAYAELKKKVAKIGDEISTRLAPVVETFAVGISTANSVAVAWDEHVKVDNFVFNQALAESILQELMSLLQGLAAQKQASPADTVGMERDKTTADELWKRLLQEMKTVNQEITSAHTEIETFRGKLANENVKELRTQVLLLELTKRRYTTEVVGLFSQMAEARIESEIAESRKKDEREKLDTLMKGILSQYEQSINVLLKKFGASFSIEKMDANFRGSAPRSEYGLKLRGKSIPLEGGPPSFATALSEGDKRTLAFAFFVASTLADPKLAQRVVVIDDPMCSLDRNRKQHTKSVLRQICSGAKQLIVLAHDLYFIRNLRNVLEAKDNQSQVAVFQLQHTENGYSDFAKIDVDRECESAYYRHHRLLMDFVCGQGSDHAHVAKAIRPLLEGYLHRRFPGLVPADLMFGQVVTFIKDAKAPHPVLFAQCLVEELQEINDYAGQFHHDTNPGNADTVVIVPSELRAFAERALNVVHRGAI